MQTRGSGTADISLDVDVVQVARPDGVDVRAAEEGLRGSLCERPQQDTEAEDVRRALRDMDRYIEEHGSFADAWRQF